MPPHRADSPLSFRHPLLRAGRPWLALGVLSAVLFLPGCPLFPENGCFVDADCAQGYACEARTGLCVASAAPVRVCDAPSQCGVNETCSHRGVCVSGDCTFSGCVSGYVCDREGGVWACIPGDSGAGGLGGGAAGTGSPGVAGQVESGGESN